MSYVAHRFAEIEAARRREAELRGQVREYLAELRRSRGVTLRELAQACGWRSVAHACEVEAGHRNWTAEAAGRAEAFLISKP